jgi:hypothetical protein
MKDPKEARVLGSHPFGMTYLEFLASCGIDGSDDFKPPVHQGIQQIWTALR